MIGRSGPPSAAQWTIEPAKISAASTMLIDRIGFSGETISTSPSSASTCSLPDRLISPSPAFSTASTSLSRTGRDDMPISASPVMRPGKAAAEPGALRLIEATSSPAPSRRR